MFGVALSRLGRAISGGRLSILIYHQVVEQLDPLRPFEPDAAIFDWQMALLSRFFSPLSLDEGVRRLRDGSLPTNAVCVTFDDGYLNNLAVAQPILAKYGIPATVYVATAFSRGRNMWNDRLLYLFANPSRRKLILAGEVAKLDDWAQRRELAYQWLSRLKYLSTEERSERIDAVYRENSIEEQSRLMMTPDEIQSLSAAGVEIGAHSVNHPILKTLPIEQQRWEIWESKKELEHWLGKSVRHFAYPNGVWGKDLDEETVRVVEQAGFETAVITDWGVCGVRTSPLLLKRFTPWDRTPFRFHLRLLCNQMSYRS